MNLQPRVFHYSLDWRFLLPSADPKHLHVLAEPNEDFSQTLAHVGIDLSQVLAFPDLRQETEKKAQSFVLPFGLPTHGVSTNSQAQVEVYASVRRRITSGGYLLVGFNNVWNVRPHFKKEYHACTPRRMTAQLRQAGFQSIRVFGAMPNLAIPAYIFDLGSEPAQFALQNRLRRKTTALRVLSLLSGTFGWKRLSNLLPCYFTVATA